MKSTRVDFLLLMSILLLTGLGIVVIYSSSSHHAMMKFGSPSHMVVKHSQKIVIGIIVLFVAMKFKAETWKKLSTPIFGMGLLLCMIVLTRMDALTMTTKGATRWIQLPGITFQPSEILKIGLILMLAKLLERNQDEIHQLKMGFMRPMYLVGLVFVMIVLQPNYSMSGMIFIIALTLIFLAGCQVKHILGFLAISFPIVVTLALSSEYRRKRIFSFLDPEGHTNSAHQQTQALISLGNGGFSGTGLGEGTQKLGYLPEPFTDSIFATIGEELGFMGTSVILVLFGILIWRGFKIAMDTQDTFVMLLASGITMGIALNVFLHIGVCLKVFPPTGQPLPLVSHGGTSLIMTMGALGILLSLSKSDASNNSHGGLA